MGKQNRTLYDETVAKVQASALAQKVRVEQRIAHLEQKNETLEAALVALYEETRKHQADFEKRILALEKDSARGGAKLRMSQKKT